MPLITSKLTVFSTGQKIIAQIEATALVCVERFTDYPQLGRFTLRDEGKTVAIGKVCRLSSHPRATGVLDVDFIRNRSHVSWKAMKVP